MPSRDDIMRRLSGRKRRGVQLIVKNRGWPEMMAEFKELADPYRYIEGGAGFVDIGRGADVEHKGSLNNIEIALIHEYGATLSARQGVKGGGIVEIPERSFIRSAFDDNRNKYDQMIEDLAKKVYDRKITVKEACGRLAIRMAVDIRKKVESVLEPPLQPETIKRKITKDPRPLLDTQKMLNAIQAVVQKGVGGTAIRETIETRVEELGE